jgi:hypothetical protein
MLFFSAPWSGSDVGNRNAHRENGQFPEKNVRYMKEEPFARRRAIAPFFGASTSRGRQAARRRQQTAGEASKPSPMAMPASSVEEIRSCD